MRLISFDLHADFAFFRKPDTNNTINLSYNIIHRPAVLGILGAILGLDGYKEKGKLPQYYEILKDIKLGIEPLNHDKGNFIKTDIKYSNTVGYANKGTTFLTEELTLVAPQYRIYLLLDETSDHHNILFAALKKGHAEYIPYLGKNEYTAWWDPKEFKEYIFFRPENNSTSIRIQTIFYKKEGLKAELPELDILNFDKEKAPFMYFERLPKDFDLNLMQYEMADFVYSSYRIKSVQTISNLYFIKERDAYVQLF